MNKNYRRFDDVKRVKFRADPLVGCCWNCIQQMGLRVDLRILLVVSVRLSIRNDEQPGSKE